MHFGILDLSATRSVAMSERNALYRRGTEMLRRERKLDENEASNAITKALNRMKERGQFEELCECFQNG